VIDPRRAAERLSGVCPGWWHQRPQTIGPKLPPHRSASLGVRGRLATPGEHQPPPQLLVFHASHRRSRESQLRQELECLDQGPSWVQQLSAWIQQTQTHVLIHGLHVSEKLGLENVFLMIEAPTTRLAFCY